MGKAQNLIIKILKYIYMLDIVITTSGSMLEDANPIVYVDESSSAPVGTTWNSLMVKKRIMSFLTIKILKYIYVGDSYYKI